MGNPVPLPSVSFSSFKNPPILRFLYSLATTLSFLSISWLIGGMEPGKLKTFLIHFFTQPPKTGIIDPFLH